MLRDGVVNWNGSAEELWNAAEASETRTNSRVARELRPALPAELPLDDQLSLVRGFCLFLKDR
nr:MobA/MobL family protein [Loktanella sp. M215]